MSKKATGRKLAKERRHWFVRWAFVGAYLPDPPAMPWLGGLPLGTVEGDGPIHPRWTGILMAILGFLIARDLDSVKALKDACSDVIDRESEETP